MKIENQEYAFQEVSRVLTVPDCNVVRANKIGSGNGEAKFYFGSKDELESFTSGRHTLDCFFLKSDLLTYMLSVEKEYKNPTQNYAEKANMPILWNERKGKIAKLPEVIEFTVDVQSQIEGPRGYINSNDKGYKLFRELSLPLISYISIMRLRNPKGKDVFYWKLFVDFDALAQQGRIAQVLTYGKKTITQESKTIQEDFHIHAQVKSAGRDAGAQARYRELLLAECPFCPITRISDERLLIASHIKPFSVSDDNEAFDPKNGFMLSPLFDRLFDQGFISFDSKKNMMVSNWLSPQNQTHCQIKAGDYIQLLPLDEEREKYLQYHRKFVFKG